MSLAKTVINKPTTILIIFALLTGLGLYIVPQIPIDLYPEMTAPILMVYSGYTGAGPEEVEQNLTKTLEGTLINVSNVKSMTSTSSEGASIVILEFDFHQDLTEAASEIRDKLEFVKDFLPEGTTNPQVFKFDLSMMPIMFLHITGTRSPEDLRQIAEDQVQPYLEQVNGVATTSINGGREKIIRVEIPQNRLEAYDLTLTQVSQMLASQNMQVGAGNVGEDDINYLVRTSGEYTSLDDIKNTVVAYKGGGMSSGTSQMPITVRLRDIATVFEGYKDQTETVYINGEPGLYLSLQKQSGTNSVEVSDAVKERLASINRGLPTGVEVSIMYDSTDMIRDALGEVIKSALTGALLAMAVLFIFLRNTRSTLIIGISIPLSLIITLMTMFFMGITLNIATLGGLTLGIGMIVDSSIVILENIFRYREKGAKAKASAFLGSQEMGTAIMASTLTTICVFLPVLMFQKELGVVGIVFKDMALTIVVSLVSSLLISITLVPVLSSKYVKLYTRKQKPLKSRALAKIDSAMEKAFTALDKAYKRALSLVLKNKKKTILICILALAVALVLFPTVGIVFFPSSDSDSVTLNITLPMGTKLEATDAVMREWEEIVRTEVHGYTELIVTSGGGGFMGTGTNTHTGSININLPPYNERVDSVQDIQEKLRGHFKDYLHADFSFSSNDMGMGGGGIDIVLKSENLALMEQVGNEIVDLIKENLPDLREPSLNISKGLPQVEVVIDRDKAYNLGLNVYSIGQEISANVAGKTATRYRSDGSEYDVMVILREEDRSTIPDLNKIFVMSSMGSRIPVSSFAELKKTTGPVSISREDQSRTLHVTAGLKPGTPENIAEQQVQRLIRDKLVSPEGVAIDYAGNWKERQAMQMQFIAIMLIAVALVFGVMASQFESLKDPFIIFLSIPLMFVGIVGIYLIMRRPFSMLTAVGLIMLAGIVVNNGIVLVDYINLLVRRGMPVFDACVEAGGNRLRPILMTSLTTIFGMVPMAFTSGDGAAMVQDIGLTMVGGMTVSTLMTLFFVPAIYAIFNKPKKKKKKYNVDMLADKSFAMGENQ